MSHAVARFALSLTVVSAALFSACQHAPIDTSDRTPSGNSDDDLYHAVYDPICKGKYSDTVTPAHMAIIEKQMANREHRIWHYFWHSTRNAWHELTDEQRAFFLSFDQRWQPPRLLGQPKGIHVDNPDTFDPKKNNAGEDFLYMHHSMMLDLFKTFAAADLPCISAWPLSQPLPQKKDALWPVTGKPAPPKDDASYTKMDAWRKNFADTSYLSKKTLGEIGYLLEISLHNNMHMRWASDNPPKGFGERPEITVESLKSGLKKYDDPHYNWLADPYSAHINPVFWKLHGLVESVTFNWLKANKYTSIDETCGTGGRCYEWKGTWVGAAPHGSTKAPGAGHGGHGDHHDGVKSPGERDLAPSFEDAFSQAVSEFVNGKPRGLPDGKNPMLAPPPQPKEIARRKRVLADAFKKLNQHAPMNRGALTKDLLKDTSSAVFDDPAAYVDHVERTEGH